MSTYISNFPNPSKPKAPKNIILDIFLESVTLHALQRLDVPKAAETNVKDQPIGFSYLACYISHIQICGDISDEEHSLVTQFGHANADLTALLNHSHAAAKRSALFTATKLRAAISRDNTDFSCAELTMQVSHSFPSLVISTVNAVESHLPRLVRIQQKMSASSSVVQSTIYHILNSSNNDLVIDPLSTIQPSFLVQIGLPQELRVDLAFRFLFHLRNCLWHLRDGDPSWRINFDDVIPMDRLFPLLRDRLLALDPDVYNVSGVASLEPVLPNLRPIGTSTWQTDDTNYSFNYVCVKLDLVSLKIIDPEGQPPCQFSFAGIAFGLRLRHYELLDEVNRRIATSQTSLPSKSTDLAQRISVSVACDDVQLTVYSYLMTFVQEVLRVQRLASPPMQKDRKARFNRFNVLDVHAVVLLKRLRLRAVAEKLTFEFGITGMRHSSNILVHFHLPKQLMNHSMLFSDMFVKARGTPSMAQPAENDDLASVMITDTMVSSVVRNENSEQTLKIAFTVNALRFSVPRSALRLYQFVEEWRADFLPGIEATAQALMSEIQKPSGKAPRPLQSQSLPKNLVLQVNGRLSRSGMYLRVMHDTWLSWEVNDTVVYLNSLGKARQTSYDFGVQLSSQTFAITTDSPDPSFETRVKLEFPPFLLSGHLDQTSIRIISLIHFLELKVKPSHWDTLLAVQQKFGQDFNDLLAVIQQTRSKRVTTSPRSSASPKPERLEFSVYVKMQGFRVGFEGQSSVLYLECPGIGGKFEGVPDKAWSITVTDLALSLAPRSSMMRQSFGFNRHQRSAFVIFDFKVLSKSQGSKHEVLEVAVTKVHAVMQPSSIGEMGDFIDELQVNVCVDILWLFDFFS